MSNLKRIFGLTLGVAMVSVFAFAFGSAPMALADSVNGNTSNGIFNITPIDATGANLGQLFFYNSVDVWTGSRIYVGPSNNLRVAATTTGVSPTLEEILGVIATHASGNPEWLEISG